MRPGSAHRQIQAKFIEKAVATIRRTQFTFEKVVYTKTSQPKSSLLASDHGDFSIEPGSIYQADLWLSPVPIRRCTRHEELGHDDFHRQSSSESHNNKYNYDKVDLRESCKSFVTIDLSRAWGLPAAGVDIISTVQGCRRCNLRKMEHRRYDTQAFIKAAKAVHGEGKYDYYMVEYLSGHEKVTIVCPKHGLFRAGGVRTSVWCRVPLCAMMMSNLHRHRRRSSENVLKRSTASRYSYLQRSCTSRASDPCHDHMSGSMATSSSESAHTSRWPWMSEVCLGPDLQEVRRLARSRRGPDGSPHPACRERRRVPLSRDAQAQGRWLRRGHQHCFGVQRQPVARRAPAISGRPTSPSHRR